VIEHPDKEEEEEEEEEGAFRCMMLCAADALSSLTAPRN